LTVILSEEHALLRRAFLAFARYAARVASGASYDIRLAREFLRFFRDFGDRRHHEEEERLLFPWLEAHGLPGQVGPLLVLRHEHELGRDLRLALSLAVDALEEFPLQAGDRERFSDLAQRYLELHLAHMEKEEAVLFPLVEELAGTSASLARHSSTPPRDREWVERMETLAADWPAVALSLAAHGTADAFGRLCDEALAAQ
jgi:hemerythrin-like domain-containing protein